MCLRNCGGTGRYRAPPLCEKRPRPLRIEAAFSRASAPARARFFETRVRDHEHDFVEQVNANVYAITSHTFHAGLLRVERRRNALARGELRSAGLPKNAGLCLRSP